MTNYKHNGKTKVAEAVSNAIAPASKSRSAMIGMLVGGAIMTPTAASAQDGSALEEIVVTGIRASLTRSVDQKRNASGVVDAISAEDMGVFPDTNLAESL
ncbi:MAG: hypothetical protein KJP04_10920, partial [Arenicella sp.]|nr:hypothetical protein [Arenicella sp.]